MKKNSGLTLVELMITISILAVVIGAVWWMLEDASTDTYTLTDKVDVQNSVTSLMNVLQRDIQQASITSDGSGNDTIFKYSSEENTWIINNGTDDGIKYSISDKVVTREDSLGEVANYNNIVVLEIISPNEEGDKLGAKVKIVGGKNATDTNETDKTRYEMNSTFYTRNTI